MRWLWIAVLCVPLAWAQPSPGQQRAEKARQALADERYQEAAALYAELVTADPKNTALHMSYGIALHGSEKHAAAAAEFRIVLARNPKFAAAWQLLGESLLAAGDKAKALEAFERALALEPNRVELQFAVADLARSVGEFDKSAALFFRLAQADTADPRLWHGLGMSYLGLARKEYAALRTAAGAEPWIERVAKAEAPSECEGDAPACRFARGELWQLLEELKAKSDAESRYWKTCAALQLMRRSFDQLSEMPAPAEMRSLFAEAEKLQARRNVDLLR